MSDENLPLRPAQPDEDPPLDVARRDEDLTLRAAQRQVDDWISQYQAGYWPPLANLARLIEETGELARLLNHRAGHKPKKPGEEAQELGLELADILYTVICLANAEGIDLDEAFRRVMHKVETRDATRYPRKQAPS